MPVQYTVRPFEPGDVEQAAAFLAARHRAGRQRFPILPAKYETADACADIVRSTMSFAMGLSALDGAGELAGFLFAIKNIPAPNSGSARFAAVRGSMMLAHGHAVAPGLAPFPVYNALFGALADAYLADGIFDHTAHVPAGDPELDAAWNDLGFGRSTAVGARPTAPLESPASTLDVRIATPDDLDAVYEIAASGNAFHAQPPVFTPYMEPHTADDVRKSFRAALANEAEAIHLALADGKPVGVLWVEGPKGSPLFTPDEACYIGDTAVLPEARGAGAGAAMLEAALAWARERGYRNVTLHYNTANPLSSAFWKGNGFEPVMYHVRRHLDERILWAKPRPER